MVDTPVAQPVHTMYEGAHLFAADAVARIRAAALRSLERHAPDGATLAQALGIEDGELAARVHERVRARLESAPLEDYRLDFEDGYGSRPDAEEDAEAARTAREVARALAAGQMPPRFGIRVKPLGTQRERSLRTLERFVAALVEAAGTFPSGFVVTLPKVESAAQAADFAAALAALEAGLGLPERALRFEFMIELPQVVMGADGRSALPGLLEASAGRALGAHFGTYDYTAACGITAAHQSMHHPVCEFAKQMMMVAYAGRGLELSDGSTNLVPAEPYPDEDFATDAARARANRDVVHAAWRRHYDDVTGSLRRGFYQGWDLHPAQLVTRYAALYMFFLTGIGSAAERLRGLLDRSAGAAASGAVQDEPATGHALRSYVARAVGCGALPEGEALELTGLSRDELHDRSFARVLAGRAGRGAR